MKFLLACLAILAAAPVAAQTRVIDGDTLILRGTTYRINGIDAPEAGQTCKTERGQSWACGDAATNALASFIANRRLECDALSQDGYGRTIGRCYADGHDIAAVMVSQGMAWAFTKYSGDYAPAEALARKAGLGIWRGPATPAWEFRAEKWAVAAQQAPDGCPIKGNISSGGRIYHPPWSPWYSRTKISPEKGERWFCDEAEAVAAGWRAPVWK